MNKGYKLIVGAFLCFTVSSMCVAVSKKQRLVKSTAEKKAYSLENLRANRIAVGAISIGMTYKEAHEKQKAVKEVNQGSIFGSMINPMANFGAQILDTNPNAQLDFTILSLQNNSNNQQN